MKKSLKPAQKPASPTTQQLLEEDELTRLAKVTEELTRTMEKTRIAEYVQ